MIRSKVPTAMFGKMLAHYRIIDQAGSGGMGVVYRARDETLRRDVALKILAPGTEGPGKDHETLLREARASSALNHPNICTIYEVGEFDQQAYIAMEFVGGEALSERIPHGGLPTETVLSYGIQSAAALEHAHSRGILHRDLKSANVRVTPEGQVKVLDFGLAVNIRESSLGGTTLAATTAPGAGPMAGTLFYMAPEILGGKMADVRSDIWSLGVLLYELAEGALPFQGRTTFELTTAILREAPAPLSPRTSPGLRAIILRCLAKQPEQRYQHAGEVRAALEALQSQADAAAGQVVPHVRSRRGVLYVGGGLAVLLLGGILAFRHRSTVPTLPAAAGGHLRLLLSSEALLEGPALSPDGKMFAYVEHSGGRSQLYLSRISGGDRVQLTNDDSRKSGARFSPDGERIVFARLKKNAEAGEICVIPTLGGEATPILEGASDPAWSADGSRLAFIVRKPGKPEVLSTSTPDGTEQRALLEADAAFPFFAEPAWSRDGGTIAVTRGRGGSNRAIWLVPAAGGVARPLTRDQPGVSSYTPVFSPDGRGVIYGSDRGGASNLWWQPLDGRPSVRLTSGPGPDSSPSVGPTGAIGFLNSRSRQVLFRFDLTTRHISNLLSDSSTVWAPAFSPDGSEIAYSRAEPDGSWHIWIIPATGGSPKQFTRGQVPEVYPRYAPGGSSILFNTWGSDTLGLWRAPRNGAPPVPVKLAIAGSDAFGDFSPDGRWLAFVRQEGGVPHVYVASADGSGTPRQLTDSSATMPRWSPDGKWIAFSSDRSFQGGILLVRPDGSGLRRLTDTGGWPVWWPDGKQVGFQALGPDGHTQIRVYSIHTGEVSTLRGLTFVGSNFPFDISPDGRWLASTNYLHVSDEIWLLEPPAGNSEP